MIQEYDAIVIGAGVSGLYALYKLRELGLSARYSRPAPTSAAPGTGIAIRVPVSTLKAIPTNTPSARNSSMDGTGASISRASRKSNGICILWRTNSI